MLAKPDKNHITPKNFVNHSNIHFNISSDSKALPKILHNRIDLFNSNMLNTNISKLRNSLNEKNTFLSKYQEKKKKNFNEFVLDPNIIYNIDTSKIERPNKNINNHFETNDNINESDHEKLNEPSVGIISLMPLRGKNFITKNSDNNSGNKFNVINKNKIDSDQKRKKQNEKIKKVYKSQKLVSDNKLFSLQFPQNNENNQNQNSNNKTNSPNKDSNENDSISKNLFISHFLNKVDSSPKPKKSKKLSLLTSTEDVLKENKNINSNNSNDENSNNFQLKDDEKDSEIKTNLLNKLNIQTNFFIDGNNNENKIYDLISKKNSTHTNLTENSVNTQNTIINIEEKSENNKKTEKSLYLEGIQKKEKISSPQSIRKENAHENVNSTDNFYRSYNEIIKFVSPRQTNQISFPNMKSNLINSMNINLSNFDFNKKADKNFIKNKIQTHLMSITSRNLLSKLSSNEILSNMQINKIDDNIANQIIYPRKSKYLEQEYSTWEDSEKTQISLKNIKSNIFYKSPSNNKTLQNKNSFNITSKRINGKKEKIEAKNDHEKLIETKKQNSPMKPNKTENNDLDNTQDSKEFTGRLRELKKSNLKDKKNKLEYVDIKKAIQTINNNIINILSNQTEEGITEGEKSKKTKKKQKKKKEDSDSDSKCSSNSFESNESNEENNEESESESDTDSEELRNEEKDKFDEDFDLKIMEQLKKMKKVTIASPKRRKNGRKFTIYDKAVMKYFDKDIRNEKHDSDVENVYSKIFGKNLEGILELRKYPARIENQTQSNKNIERRKFSKKNYVCKNICDMKEKIHFMKGLLDYSYSKIICDKVRIISDTVKKTNLKKKLKNVENLREHEIKEVIQNLNDLKDLDVGYLLTESYVDDVETFNDSNKIKEDSFLDYDPPEKSHQIVKNSNNKKIFQPINKIYDQLKCKVEKVDKRLKKELSEVNNKSIQNFLTLYKKSTTLLTTLKSDCSLISEKNDNDKSSTFLKFADLFENLPNFCKNYKREEDLHATVVNKTKITEIENKNNDSDLPLIKNRCQNKIKNRNGQSFDFSQNISQLKQEFHISYSPTSRIFQKEKRNNLSLINFKINQVNNNEYNLKFDLNESNEKSRNNEILIDKISNLRHSQRTMNIKKINLKDTIKFKPHNENKPIKAFDNVLNVNKNKETNKNYLYTEDCNQISPTKKVIISFDRSNEGWVDKETNFSKLL